MITGEVGSGKTVAARAATAALDASRHTVIYLGNPAIGARGLYAAIVTALGGVPRFHKASLIPQAADALAAEEAERGKRVVVVVDEAHLLAADQLEELRLLTNADMDSHSAFACLLVGQPTLRRRIKLGTFAALDQRIALRFAMPPMTPAETAAYIAHHLKLAGRADTLFSDDAVALIHQVSRGLPRAVNNLAAAGPRRRLRRQEGHRRRVLGPSRRHRDHRRVVITNDTMETATARDFNASGRRLHRTCRRHAHRACRPTPSPARTSAAS